MPVSAAAVGVSLPESTEEVSVRRILAYAAGVGETGAATFDDTADDFVAPPAFCVSLEWPVVSHPEVARLLGAPREEIVRGVHSTQDSHFHRPIRPGDRLTTGARIVGLQQTRAGALLVIRIETRDDAGEPVVTSWSQTIYRGVGIEGDPHTIEEPPPVPALEEGGDWERTEISTARELPHVYTECARIWNPIHTERRVALPAGLPDIIVHGTATWALAAREIVAQKAGADPRRLRRLHGRFRAMVVAGTAITIEQREAGTDTLAFRVRNADGAEAIAGGFAVLG